MKLPSLKKTSLNKYGKHVCHSLDNDR